MKMVNFARKKKTVIVVRASIRNTTVMENFHKKKFECFVQKFSRMVFPKSDEEGKTDCTNKDMAQSFNIMKKAAIHH